MLNVVAPPIFSSPALAALMGLNAAITLALLLACVAATPFLAPALVAAFVGPAVTFSPVALGLAAGADAGGRGLRRHRGPRRRWASPGSSARPSASTGSMSSCCSSSRVALMGDVLANTIARPMLVLGPAGAVHGGDVRAERR